MLRLGEINPLYTQYAIYETVIGNYVQSDGTLGVGGTIAATWGTKVVTGLRPILNILLKLRQNLEAVETAYSATASHYTLADRRLVWQSAKQQIKRIIK